MTGSTTSQRLLFLLGAAQRRVQQAGKRGTEPGPARGGLLVAIATDPAGTPMAAVGRALDLGASALTGLVDRAEAQGLVVRAPDPGDGRAWRLILTDAGLARRRAVIERIHAMNDLAAEGFSAAELDIVARWLEAMRIKFTQEDDA